MKIMELDGLDGKSYSVLAVSPPDRLQEAADGMIGEYTKAGIAGVYVCFNKPQKAVKELLEKRGVDTSKVFFIDCITASLGEAENEKNVIHIQSPSDLTSLSIAINEFLEKVPGEKFLLIDALATLLIYNTEALVIKFVKSMVEETSRYGLKTVMLTPEARGGDLVNRISLYFDKVLRV